MKNNFEFQEYRDDLAEKIKSEENKEERKKILEKAENTPQYKAAELLHKEDIREGMEASSPERRSLEAEENKKLAQKENKISLRTINRDFYDRTGMYVYEGGGGFLFKGSKEDKKDNSEATKLVVEFIKNNVERFSDAGYYFNVFPRSGGTNITEISLISPEYSVGSNAEDVTGGDTVALFDYGDGKDVDATKFISEAEKALKDVAPRHKQETSKERKDNKKEDEWWNKEGAVWNDTNKK